ncbi:MAG: hypothetical protein IPI02_06490 [Sterolibacteriaceae bacterium]|nr:hypothetical protein [Sterolibacteriaceae bacterium]
MGKQLADVRFPIAHTHSELWIALYRRHRLIALEPAIALLLFNCQGVALRLLAERLRITGPTLRIDKAQRHPLHRHRQAAVQMQALRTVGRGADRTQALDAQLGVVPLVVSCGTSTTEPSPNSLMRCSAA